ncbi:ectoine/hydroxyectoine ABC transporter permease subunit EhuD [Shinella sp. DD12]|uniref:ectoine/hydroxyectoine ABC transporter permease subunit EhuD n=1 Tax=Shinella sp. DD12 TaxID=1410620 RepID=UPI0003C543BB|nr:ectoine/hydroxyectoine ABC transporter permease subunit EhuD [Shinella sp. DD12]EYR77454.1 putative amino-acid ABC transporter permease protein y4tG [Shinella sp. DD12]
MIYGYEIDTSSPGRFALSILPILLIGLRTTVLAMLVGLVIALFAGLAFALLRRSPYRVVSWPAVAIIEFLRNTPLLMQLFFLYFVLPEYGLVLPAFWTGCIALGLQYAAYMSEVYRAGLEAIPNGQWEAAKALNLSRGRVYGAVVIPQIVPRITPAIGNYLVSMMKDTPILSTITVVEMLNLANRIGDRTFEYLVPLSVVGAIFLVLTCICSALLRGVEWAIPKRGIALK